MVDTNGDLKNDGKDTVFLKVEQACDSTRNYCCGVTPSSDNVPGLPIETQMTVRSDGQYEATFAISGGSGTIFVSAEVQGVGGLRGSYYQSYDTTVPADICQTDKTIDFSWDANNMFPASTNPGITVAWTGYISPPTSETYLIKTTSRSTVLVSTLDGLNLSVGEYSSIDMEVGKLYKLDWMLQAAKGIGVAGLTLEWFSNSTPLQVIPESAYHSQ